MKTRYHHWTPEEQAEDTPAVVDAIASMVVTSTLDRGVYDIHEQCVTIVDVPKWTLLPMAVGPQWNEKAQGYWRAELIRAREDLIGERRALLATYWIEPCDDQKVKSSPLSEKETENVAGNVSGDDRGCDDRQGEVRSAGHD